MSIRNKVTGDLPNITTYNADGSIQSLAVPGNVTSGGLVTGNAVVGNVHVQNNAKILLDGGASIYSIANGGLVNTTEVNSANDRGISVTAGGNVPGSSYAQLQWVQDINNYDPYGAANAVTNWIYVQNDGIYFENIDNLNSPGYDHLTTYNLNGDWSMPANISAAGNVEAAYFTGNGAGLTGLPSGFSNAEVAIFLASGNLTTDIVTTGNAYANTMTANLFIGNFSGNLVVPGANTEILYNEDGNIGTDGTVWSWGCNNYAQVGNGTWSSSNVLSPSRLPLPKGVTFKLGGCYSSGGNDAITRFLISTDNRIFAWGYNGSNAIDSTDGTSNYYYPVGFYPPNLLA